MTHVVGKIYTQASGPFNGVRDSNEPFDDVPNLLTGGNNVYLPDPVGGSGAYARPGFIRGSSVADASGGPAGGVFRWTGSNNGTGVDLNFQFRNNKIFRGDLTGWTDVTPTNVYFNTNVGLSRKVFCGNLGSSMIVSDGLNQPIVCTNLTSTPITAQYIDAFPATVLLSRGSIDTKVASSAVATPNGNIAAIVAGTSLPAGTIPLNTWGVFRVQASSSNVVSVSAGAANFTTGYANEAAAVAAVPAVTGNNWNLGYFTVQTKVGTTFVGGTDALFGGASGNIANATNYYAGQSPYWSAYGASAVYTGAIFFIIYQRADTGTIKTDRLTIIWSEPNQPLAGYIQTNFADFWTLLQTGTTPLYSLVATNSALYYSRLGSWGSLTGAPSINFQNTATHDTISVNIGCVAPATVKVFGNLIYFCDQNGRPSRFAEGGKIEQLWLNMRTAIQVATVANHAEPNAVEGVAWAEVEPNLNVYIAAPYGSTGLDDNRPSLFYVFDAFTGMYCGEWSMAGPLAVDAVGQMVTAQGSTGLGVQQAATSGNLGYLWQLAVQADMGNIFPGSQIYADNGVAFNPSIETQRLGYSMENSWNVSEVRSLTSDISAVDMTVITPYNTVDLGSVTAPNSNDSTFRQVWDPAGLAGRGFLCVATQSGNTVPTVQWVIYRVEADMTVAEAPPDVP